VNELVLTLDVDWAPDFVIESVAAELRSRRVRATWFVTHRSPAVETLRADGDLFELGIHPNFRFHSTQGADAEAVVANLLAIVPEAVSVRSHGLVQSGDLIGMLATRTPLERDASTFLPELPNLRPVTHWRSGVPFVRVPFFWADDHEMQKPAPVWTLTRFLEIPGLKVFDFHPLLVYLNLARLDAYEELKRECDDLSRADRALVDRYVHAGEGAGTLFRELAEHLERVGSTVLAEIP
jgi:hypothetical protein